MYPSVRPWRGCQAHTQPSLTQQAAASACGPVGVFSKKHTRGINPGVQIEQKSRGVADHEISARQKGTTISLSKSCLESSDLGTVCGSKQMHFHCIPRAFQRALSSEKQSITPVTRPGGHSGAWLTGTGSGRCQGARAPTPRGVKPSLSDDTLTLELDQLPRVHVDPAYHNCFLIDRDLKPRRHTMMPRYWLGDQQIISTYSLIHNVVTTMTQASYLELAHTLTLMIPRLPRKAPCQSLRLHLQVEREWVP